MRLTITSQQFDFFHREGHVEFEAIYSKEELEALKTLLDTAFSLNDSGRDLERGNVFLKKALKLSRLAQVFTALFNKNPLKLAFTQYHPSYKAIAALADVSSISETIGWALVNLGDDPLPDLAYLPMGLGDVGFYTNEFPIDFTVLERPVHLIAFSRQNARYQIQTKDPYTHKLKKLGYGSGDLLRDETHPLILNTT